MEGKTLYSIEPSDETIDVIREQRMIRDKIKILFFCLESIFIKPESR